VVDVPEMVVIRSEVRTLVICEVVLVVRSGKTAEVTLTSTCVDVRAVVVPVGALVERPGVAVTAVVAARSVVVFGAPAGPVLVTVTESRLKAVDDKTNVDAAEFVPDDGPNVAVPEFVAAGLLPKTAVIGEPLPDDGIAVVVNASGLVYTISVLDMSRVKPFPGDGLAVVIDASGLVVTVSLFDVSSDEPLSDDGLVVVVDASGLVAALSVPDMSLAKPLPDDGLVDIVGVAGFVAAKSLLDDVAVLGPSYVEDAAPMALGSVIALALPKSVAADKLSPDNSDVCVVSGPVATVPLLKTVVAEKLSSDDGVVFVVSGSMSVGPLLEVVKRVGELELCVESTGPHSMTVTVLTPRGFMDAT
jgi:hypothetical protein